MKKAVLVIVVLMLFTMVAVNALAELSVGESGKIDSTVIFDILPVVPDKEPEGEPETDKEPEKDDGEAGGKYVTPKNPEKKDEPEKETVLHFDDVSENDWFYREVAYVYGNKIMLGSSENSFAPMASVTRAMAITVVYRMAGEPHADGSSFDDVKPSTWYAKAVAWGAEKGIINGVGNNKFAPNGNITREQMAVILYNYCKSLGKAVSLSDISSYSDSNSVSSWAKEAMAWAVGNKIINGRTASILAPAENITRAEAAAVLMRLSELIK